MEIKLKNKKTKQEEILNNIEIPLKDNHKFNITQSLTALTGRSGLALTPLLFHIADYLKEKYEINILYIPYQQITNINQKIDMDFKIDKDKPTLILISSYGCNLDFYALDLAVKNLKTEFRDIKEQNNNFMMILTTVRRIVLNNIPLQNIRLF